MANKTKARPCYGCGTMMEVAQDDMATLFCPKCSTPKAEPYTQNIDILCGAADCVYNNTPLCEASGPGRAIIIMLGGKCKNFSSRYPTDVTVDPSNGEGGIET